MIKERFLYFKTVEAFDQAREQINSSAIVFIEDVQSIVAQDKNKAFHIFGTWNGKDSNGNVVVDEAPKDVNQLDSTTIQYITQELNNYYTTEQVQQILDDYYTKDEVYTKEQTYSKDEVDKKLRENYYTKNDIDSNYYTKKQTDDQIGDALYDYVTKSQIDDTISAIQDQINNLPDGSTTIVPSPVPDLTDEVNDLTNRVQSLEGINHNQFLTEHQDISGKANTSDLTSLAGRVTALENAPQKNEHSKGFFNSPNDLPADGEEGDWAIVDVSGTWYIYNHDGTEWSQGETFTIEVSEQLQADWEQTNTSAKDYIKNKPTLFDGSYNSLSNKPTLFSGSYNDLTDKPTIPTPADLDLSDKADKSDLDDYLKKEEVYTPDVKSSMGVAGADQPGAEPRRAPVNVAYNYATWEDVQNYIDLVLSAVQVGSGTGESGTISSADIARIKQEILSNIVSSYYTKSEVYKKDETDNKIAVELEEFKNKQIDPTITSIFEILDSLSNGDGTGTFTVPSSVINELNSLRSDITALQAINHTQFLTSNSQVIESLQNTIQGIRNSIQYNEHAKGFFDSEDDLPSTGQSGDWAIVNVEGQWYIYTHDGTNWSRGNTFNIEVSGQVQANWNQTDQNAVDYIKNKPTLFSGSYNDLTDKPTIPSQVEIDPSITQDIEDLKTDVATLKGINHSQITTNAQNIQTLQGKVTTLENAQHYNEHSKGFFNSASDLPASGEEGDWAIVDVSGAWYIYTYDGTDWNPGSTFTLDLSGYLTENDLADYAKTEDLPTIPTNVSAFNNDAGYLTNANVYSPNPPTIGVAGNDQPGADPRRAPKNVTYDYATVGFVSEYVPAVVESTITNIQEGSGGVFGSQPANIVIEQADYEALETYQPNAIYFVLEPREEINWTFGGTFPITLSGSDSLGAFPINLT